MAPKSARKAVPVKRPRRAVLETTHVPTPATAAAIKRMREGRYIECDTADAAIKRLGLGA